MGTVLLAGLIGLAVVLAGSFPSGPSATPLEVVAAAMPDPSVEPAVAPAALIPKASVKSGDGLRLDLTSTGAIASVRSGSRTLPRLTTTLPGGFSMRKVGGTANLVRNGGFESGTTSWTISGTPAPTLASVFRTGTRSLKVSRSTIGDTGTFSQKLAVKPNTSYVAGAWVRTKDVKPSSTGVGNLATTNGADSPVQIRVDQLSSSGTVLSTHWIVGYTDSSDLDRLWNTHSVGFRTRSTTTAVKLTGRLKKGQGTAWFDDVWVKPLFADRGDHQAGRQRHDRPGRVGQRLDLQGEIQAGIQPHPRERISHRHLGEGASADVLAPGQRRRLALGRPPAEVAHDRVRRHVRAGILRHDRDEPLSLRGSERWQQRAGRRYEAVAAQPLALPLRLP
jgi:hypothetical protein